MKKISSISFADVAHGNLIFNESEQVEKLVIDLLNTKWVQRLRNISQTGNTKLVYMFAEHSRFGHSLGVAYLAITLMSHLKRFYPEAIKKHELAVAAAAILHDIGHVAPGSHLAERIWKQSKSSSHEDISCKIIKEDPEIINILEKYQPKLAEETIKILEEDKSIAPWATSVISGGGWNADRGNWAIVDSTMCAVTYGRYNVNALIDAYRLSDKLELVLHESRLDALTHFFVARDSMYRQIYQHRVIQAVDVLNLNIIIRLRDLLSENADFNKLGIFVDSTMLATLKSNNYIEELSLENIFNMTESWWNYHLNKWCDSEDNILNDLSKRLRDRILFKTIRIRENNSIIQKAKELSLKLGFNPKYYVAHVKDADAHRGKTEPAPSILLDSGKVVAVDEIEPLIGQLQAASQQKREWIAVPAEIKKELGLER